MAHQRKPAARGPYKSVAEKQTRYLTFPSYKDVDKAIRTIRAELGISNNSKAIRFAIRSLAERLVRPATNTHQ